MVFCFHHAIARSSRSESSVSFATAGLISPPACQFGRPGARRGVHCASGLCFPSLPTRFSTWSSVCFSTWSSHSSPLAHVGQLILEPG